MKPTESSIYNAMKKALEEGASLVPIIVGKEPTGYLLKVDYGKTNRFGEIKKPFCIRFSVIDAFAKEVAGFAPCDYDVELFDILSGSRDYISSISADLFFRIPDKVLEPVATYNS